MVYRMWISNEFGWVAVLSDMERLVIVRWRRRRRARQRSFRGVRDFFFRRPTQETLRNSQQEVTQEQNP